MALAFVVATIFVLQHFGPLSLVAILAVIGGGGSILCAAVLMGLAFLSSGTGHDEAVAAWDRPGEDGQV